ncbi:MAG: lipopolysaccharide biosynthesis protein [Rhodocyclaceae bacterium]|nr:lipopolysaccharide biosynthesis protein [Rhodocyclaceae bacterium]MBX3669792.1 lipopolysaccharide biosynthesis protein [Rhodocyclaceae bacterium]
MSSVRKSILYSLSQNYLMLVLQLATSMVLARILRPAEVGVFSVAASMSALATVVRDFGVAEYLIQETDLTPDKLRAALTVNIMVSWLMAIMMFGGSFFAADFYRDAGIGSVMRVLAFNFVLIPFGAVTMAYFRRQMNFAPGFRIAVVAGIASSITSITLGLSGFSYMSMAYSSLLGVAITVAMSIFMRPPEMPRWPGIKGVKDVLVFGGFASGIYIFGQLGRSAPDLIIGRFAGMASVGFLSRANGLLEIFSRTVMSAVNSVALPYFAATRREGGDVGAGLLRTVLMTTSIGWPFYAVCGILALPAIRVLFGPQWDAAAPLLRILCFALAIDLVMLTATEVLLALSRVKLSSLLQACLQVLKVLVMLAFAPFGLVAFCYGVVLASALNVLVALYFLRKALPLRAIDLLRACLPAAGLALAAALGAMGGLVLADQVLPIDFARAAIGGITALAVTVATMFASGHPYAAELKKSGALVRDAYRKLRAR